MEKYHHVVVMLFSLLLLSANFVGDYSLQIFHFSYSAGTFVMQLVFCCIVVFCELFGLKRTIWIICQTALINVLVALIAYWWLNLPLPAFWMNHAQDAGRLPQVVLTLTLAYVCSAVVMVLVSNLVKILFGQDWLLLRVMLGLTAGCFIDSAMLLPVLYYLSADRYMALWKMLSLASVKCSLSLISLPFTYLIICILKRSSHIDSKDFSLD
ncbi:MAG: VUT family protein [Proteobacteria bacterium]|nr:VUT family protein [Pseudomonadota bacterium]